MPELAEVDHSRRQWDAGLNARVEEVLLARTDSRIFRGTDPGEMCRLLRGQTLRDSETRGKQIAFHFTGELWLGIHLGMRGELRCERPATTADHAPRKHDYLALRMSNGSVLVFEDKRLFGRVQFHHGASAPAWWTGLAPSLLSREFTRALLASFLERRRRTPIKAALLMQERFPGVGNWMADEILWRAHIHPETPCGALTAAETAAIFRTVRWVSRTAMRIISDDWSYPASWLFLHRWEPGGRCPRCRLALHRGTVGGRTTCWCPQCQPPRREFRPPAAVAAPDISKSESGGTPASPSPRPRVIPPPRSRERSRGRRAETARAAGRAAR